MAPTSADDSFRSAAASNGIPFYYLHSSRRDIAAVSIYKLKLIAGAPPPQGMPAQLDTVGDHLRAARIRKRLGQAQLAELLGVTKFTVWNWENKRSSPRTHQCGAIISFLGYDPFPEPQTFAERLVAFRRARGLTTRMAASLAGVDPASWQSWERNEHVITASHRSRLETVLSGQDGNG